MTAEPLAIDHRAAIARLSRSEREALLAKSDAAGARQLALHLGAMALAALGLHAGGVWWWPSLLVYGVLLVFLFTAQHESVHFTAFKTRWVNQWLANAVGWLLFNPAHWFRYFHLAHHRYTQDPQSDPELASGKPETRVQYIWHVLGWQTIVAGIRTVFGNALGRVDESWLPANQRSRVVREARVMLVLYALVAAVSLTTRSTVLIEFWLLPLVVGQPALRLYLLAEHGRCPAVANMFENTRTTFTNVVMRRLAWNMPYHAEHHAFPSVPFHRLPAWHRHVVSDLRCTERGYVRFNQQYVKDL